MTDNTGTITGSKESPRFDDIKDILYWYAGDAFSIDWGLQLMNIDDDTPHPYAEEDKLIITFFDVKKNQVHQFSFDHILNNTVTTVFTPAISKKFPAGMYTYCIKYCWTDEDEQPRIQTIVDNKKVKVEACH